MTAVGDLPDQPHAVLEFELTEEMAVRAAVVLFEVQVRDVKRKMLMLGAPHPAFPLVVASATLLIAMVIALVVAIGSPIAIALVLAGVLVELLLAFKAALYFWPAFAQWYIRFMVLRLTRRRASRTVRWLFFEDRLESQSSYSNRQLPWIELSKVEEVHEFWLLTWQTGSPLAIAAAILPDEHRSFLLQKAAGA